MTNSDTFRRSSPAIWNTDWLVLRGLRAVLGRSLSQLGMIGSVIDFGCGAHPYRALVELHGLTYRGADFGKDADIAISLDGKLPADTPRAEIILSMQVLEHVRDLDAYFREAARVLVDDGKLLLSTHGTWLYHPHPADYRRWTRTGLKEEIEMRGFLVEEITAIVGPLATTTLIRLTSFAWVLRRIPLIGKIVANTLAIVMNLRALIEDYLTPETVTEYNGCVYMAQCRKAPES